MNRIVGAMAKLRKSDAFRFGSFTKDLGGLGKRMWITHSSMDVVIALNMGVTGFDMAPGFTKNGTWYDYFTGEAINVTNASGHTVYFEPGAYRVFTSVALPKPFHELTIKVLDDESGLPMEGAQVNLGGAGNRLTDGTGTALFLSLPQPVTVTATKFGWIKKSVTATVSGAAEITIRMIKDESAVGEEEEGEELRVYPNPAHGKITVETKEPGFIHIFNMDGKLMMEYFLENNSGMIDVSALGKGVYILFFEGNDSNCFKKVVIL
jgi:hypothetical protein